MGFWTRVLGVDGITANANPPPTPDSVGADYHPGDPDGFELQGFDTPSEDRALPWLQPSPWSGWPNGWSTPAFSSAQNGLNNLVDVAFACLDLNCNVLSSMPVYRLRNGSIIEPTTWMMNPDPTIYTSWQEFAKQLAWDYQMGEAFVLPMAHGADGFPLTFRVIPPWLISVEMRGGQRQYFLGGINGRDVTEDILHIRYKSTIDNARGVGPLESAGARLTAVTMLQRYANNLAETGGVPMYWLELERKLNKSEAFDLLDTWIETRAKYAGHPAITSAGAKLNQATSMNAKDMALMELSQFNESRIAILFGVPPFLVGLAGATGSLTYSNISDLFDFHDRSSLRPKARMMMEALSGWALPRGQSLELNRDDYTRPTLEKRAAAYKILIELGVLTVEEARSMERLHGEPAAQALTGSAD